MGLSPVQGVKNAEFRLVIHSFLPFIISDGFSTIMTIVVKEVRVEITVISVNKEAVSICHIFLLDPRGCSF